MTNYITITSGKGGTGKTTTAINIGTALSQFKRHSIVVDANLNTPNVALQLGSANLPNTLHDVLNGTRNIKETAYSHPSGLIIIPASINAEKTEIHTLQEAIKNLEGTTETVIIDTPPGLGKETEQAIQTANQTLIVTNPEMTAITEALKIIKKTKQENVKVFGIVLNRVTGQEHELTKENVEKILGHKVIAVIEEDDYIKKSLKQKHPVTHLYPNSKSAISFKKLAAQLVGEEYQEGSNKKRGIFSWLKKN